MVLAVAFSLLLSQQAASTPVRELYKPSEEELRASYRRADTIGQTYNSRVFKVRLDPSWFDGNKRFWYLNRLPNNRAEYWQVEASTGRKTALFDAAKLDAALGKELGQFFGPDRLPLGNLAVAEDGKSMEFSAGGARWSVDLQTYALKKLEQREPPRQRPPAPWRQNLWPPDTQRRNSRDGKWTVQIIDHNVSLGPADSALTPVTNSGSDKAYFARVSWSPNSKFVVATRVTPGDRKEVHLLESSPRGGTRAILQSRVYDQPGDKVDTFDHWIIDVEAKKATQSKAETIDYGSLPGLRWVKGGAAYTYEKMDRGYGRWRLIEVDAATAEPRTIIDDDPETFVDSTSQFIRYLDNDEIIFRSERDGWGHLYLVDSAKGQIKNQITKGSWVVRGVTRVDDEKRQIWFTASGEEPGQDPYFIHYYRINFDGTAMVRLTEGDGNHEARFSPDFRYLVDTWSRVDKAPVHELRDANTGKLITKLEEADISTLSATGWKAPQVFTAKGRDGKADIWGVVYRPSHFDRNKKYPVIEDIYAGPHDSFVPKSFAAHRSMQSLAELGFIVVKIDGMGTRNRGKAFHDVAYKNIADAGLPDRILWMKALAATDPSVDIERVGIFGGSAGGQSSTGALLFHPDFYDVAVSSCGCHDNRIDKIWWNEQWMGQVGPHYAEQSNITNAHKLRGKLMLIVGELDDNVPPESTYQLADALIKANKEFDLLVLPGAGHTGGGNYGERKRRDFFVRHLLGVPTPEWNASGR